MTTKIRRRKRFDTITLTQEEFHEMKLIFTLNYILSLFGYEVSLTLFISFFQSSAFLNSLKKRTIRSKVKEEGNEMNLTLFTEELQDVKSNVADRWYKLKGMPRETAVVCYK